MMYRKVVERTNSSYKTPSTDCPTGARGNPEVGRTGVMSTMSFHNGFDLDLAYMSQIAFPTAPVAMWMTPFSGPTLAIAILLNSGKGGGGEFPTNGVVSLR